MTSVALEVQYFFVIGINFGEKLPPNILHSLLPSLLLAFLSSSSYHKRPMLAFYYRGGGIGRRKGLKITTYFTKSSYIKG